MGGLRHWIRRAERAARASSDEITLLDEESGETFQVPRDAFPRVLGSLMVEDPDDDVAQILDRLDRLVYPDGTRFWLEDMRWSNKTAGSGKMANTEEGYEE